MWILECDGDVLQHKKLWLRPGKKYLFGRTKTEQGGFAIENKSISRKHLTIEVARNQTGDGSRVHTRSRIIIEDQNSKIGTLVNGEQIRGQAKDLQADKYHIQLGSLQYLFRILWRPVVLSFSFSTKEQKNRDPLESVRARLEPLDIKAVIPYLIEKTTHVVATKRNTAKGLQALINAKYIVTDSFVDAVVDAATPSDPDDPEAISRLEEDYDAAWPDPLQRLPPPGKEPSQRPAAYFAPDDRRANVFEGYTFVFCDRTQYENLQSPINNGGGKALMYELDFGKTSVQEVVRYIKRVAGEKGTGEFEDQSEGKGVVLVRFRGPKGMEDWSIELGNEVARALDQRLIEQSEFLDAILVNDASGLRRPLPEEDDVAPSNPQESTEPSVRMRDGSSSIPALAQPTSEEPSIPFPRVRPRRPIVSQFKGFDDGFDPSSLGPPLKKFEDGFPSQHQEGEERRPRQGERGTASQMQGDASGPREQSNKDQASRKRRSAPSSEDEDDEAVMDQILPAAAAMKRRRIEEEQRGEHEEGQFVSSMTNATQGDPTSGRGNSRKTKKPVDVLGAAREHREAEDEAVRLDEEALKAPIDGEEIGKMRDLVVVETMLVRTSAERSSRTENHTGERGRWDENWNGRKNFKKFRKRGTEHGQPRRGGTVIVGLEEVKKRGFGVTEEYWLAGDKQKRRQQEREQQESLATSESRSQSYARTKSQAVETDEHVAVEGSTADKASLSTTTTTTTRLADKTNVSRLVTMHDEGGSSSNKSRLLASGKRSGSNSMMAESSTTAPSRKKQKTLFFRESDSDGSEEDELRFRFNKAR